jgi:MYXO-CTERM domain-containing protein
MFVTNHVLAGAVLGLVVRRPAAVFPVAVVSHLAMDRVPHWGLRSTREFDPAAFLRVAVRDGLVGLATMAAATAVTPAPLRRAVVAGMLGAALLDVDKPAELVGWHPVPAAVQRLHVAVQREDEAHLGREVAVGAGLALAVLAGAHRRRRR